MKRWLIGTGLALVVAFGGTGAAIALAAPGPDPAMPAGPMTPMPAGMHDAMPAEVKAWCDDMYARMGTDGMAPMGSMHPTGDAGPMGGHDMGGMGR